MLKNTNAIKLTAGIGLMVAASANADLLNAFEVGYAWSGEDFGGTPVSGYVVDLYLEFDGPGDILLNIYNYNASNQGDNPTYFQGLTAAGWAPNEQGSIFTTEVSRSFDSFIAIGGVGAEDGNGNPYQMPGNGVAVDPNFGQSSPTGGDGGNNNAYGPGYDAGWFNGNPNNTIGTAVGGAVFIGRFSIAGSDGFSLVGSTGFATWNTGLGTPGQQGSWTVMGAGDGDGDGDDSSPVPGPGGLVALGGLGLISRRRRR